MRFTNRDRYSRLCRPTISLTGFLLLVATLVLGTNNSFAQDVVGENLVLNDPLEARITAAAFGLRFVVGQSSPILMDQINIEFFKDLEFSTSEAKLSGQDILTIDMKNTDASIELDDEVTVVGDLNVDEAINTSIITFGDDLTDLDNRWFNAKFGEAYVTGFAPENGNTM